MKGKMENQERNLNPHKPAKAAMWLFGDKYARQRGGSMDFWDSLSQSEKMLCRELIRDVNDARDEQEIEIDLSVNQQ